MIAVGLLFVRRLCDYFESRQRLEAEILVQMARTTVARKYLNSILFQPLRSVLQVLQELVIAV
jgi:hypothetical protein